MAQKGQNKRCRFQIYSSCRPQMRDNPSIAILNTKYPMHQNFSTANFPLFFLLPPFVHLPKLLLGCQESMPPGAASRARNTIALVVTEIRSGESARRSHRRRNPFRLTSGSCNGLVIPCYSLEASSSHSHFISPTPPASPPPQPQRDGRPR